MIDTLSVYDVIVSVLSPDPLTTVSHPHIYLLEVYRPFNHTLQAVSYFSTAEQDHPAKKLCSTWDTDVPSKITSRSDLDCHSFKVLLVCEACYSSLPLNRKQRATTMGFSPILFRVAGGIGTDFGEAHRFDRRLGWSLGGAANWLDMD